MSFRARLFAGVFGLIAAFTGATLLGLELVVRREILLRLSEDLDASRDALKEELSRDLGRLAVEARVASDEPRIKALLDTEGMDVETLEDVAEETRRNAGWDLLALGTANRTASAVVGPSGRPGPPPLFEPSFDREVSGYWADGASVFRGAARPVSLGRQTIGSLLVANRLGDREVERLGKTASVRLALFGGGTLAAAGFSDPGARAALASLADRPAPPELSLAGELFLSRSLPLADGAVRLVVLRSSEAALAPYRRLRAGVLGVGAATLLLALAFATALSRGLSNPIARLDAAVRDVAAGDLRARAPLGGGLELDRLSSSFNAMVGEVARTREELARAEALKRELQIARAIQTGVLPPPRAGLPGFEVAARMEPASEVGGDYYDVLQRGDSSWILIGDVSGHGLNAGLLMLILQSAALSALTARPDLSPRELVAHLNRVFHEELLRMGTSQYATLMALRHEGEGRFAAAGGHQPIFLVRRDGRVDVVEPKGPWCGIDPAVGAQLVELRFELQPGDWMWLVTDGVLEARDFAGKQFGDDRLSQCLAVLRKERPDAAVAAALRTVAAWMERPEDDMTLVAVKRLEGSAT